MKAWLIAACFSAVAIASVASPPSTPLTIRERSDGSLTIRMRDGSLVTARPTSTGRLVSFPGSNRGDQIWTRTTTGWSVTDLEATRAANAARWETPPAAAPKTTAKLRSAPTPPAKSR